MVGLLELLRERFDHLDRATIADYLDVLRRNTDRLTALVEDLLFATNLRSGQVSAVPTAVRVLPAVTRAAHRYLKTASAEVTGAEAVVWCDPEHLDQVLNALLGNAARHGRPPYRVDVTEVDGAVQIMVVDGGSGIPQDHVEALFEPFLQGSMGDQRTATRLGLGLPIARALIRANGGDLSYEPTADGAAFRIELPTPRWERAASSTRRTEA